MRFLKGLLGSWAGLMLFVLIMSATTGSLGNVMHDLLTISINILLFAAVGSTAIAFLEKPTWSWKRYAITGVLSSGLALFIGFCVVANSIMQASGLVLGTGAFAIAAVTFAVAGALSGTGYRSFSGNLTQ